VCEFLCGGGGDDKDVMFDKTLAWFCCAKACVKALEGLCCQGWLLRWVPTFIKDVYFVEKWERRSFYIIRTILLCLVIHMLLKLVFVHMESRWRHVFVSCSGPRLQRGEENWVHQIMCFLLLAMYRSY
jgi:hypothetical protein